MRAAFQQKIEGLLRGQGPDDPSGATAGEMSEKQLLRLQTLAKSGLVSSRVAWWEEAQFGSEKSSWREKGELLFKECRDVQKWLDALPHHSPSFDAAAYSLACCVTQNALGRVASRLGKRDEAKGALLRAMALSPDFVDPYVNMAALLMDFRKSEAQDWPARAKALLEKASSIDPANLRVAFQHARLYSFDVFGDYDRGIALLKDLSPDPKILFLRATLYSRKKQSALAVAELNRILALNLSPKTVDLFARLVVRLKPEEGRKAMLKKALSCVQRMRKLYPKKESWPRMEARLMEAMSKPAPAAEAPCDDPDDEINAPPSGAAETSTEEE